MKRNHLKNIFPTLLLRTSTFFVPRRREAIASFHPMTSFLNRGAVIVTILKLIEDDGMCDNLIKWTIFVIFSWGAPQKLLCGVFCNRQHLCGKKVS